MNSCNRLPCAHEVLAVFAHPDDESFGLGAVLGDFTAQGTRLRGLCFTHGEASTLGRTDRNLGEVRGRNSPLRHRSWVSIMCNYSHTRITV